MQLTLRLLTSVPSLPFQSARSQAVLKIVVLFIANMAAQPRRAARTKALRLACWNADGVHGRKQELDHFLGQYGIDIFLLTETHLRSGVIFRMANDVCHHNDWLTKVGGTAIVFRHGIDHHAVPVQCLKHL